MPLWTSRRHFIKQALGGPIAFALAGGRSEAAVEHKLRFSYQHSSTLLTILKEKQILEKRLGARGYDISWSLFGSVIEPMNAGSVDFHADVADAVPVFTQSAGARLTFYAKEDPSPSAEAIIVHADSPIRTIADLKGRTVGVSKGSGCHFLLAAALKREGLSFQDIRPAYLESAAGAAAFQGRSIDAWVIWDPFLAITQSKEAVRVIADGTGITSYFRYYFVNDSFAAEHPEIVQIVFDALVETGQWVKSNQRATAELLAPLWGDVSAETVEVVNSRRSYVVRPVEKEALSEQQMIADTFFEAGLIPKKLVATDVRIWHPATAACSGGSCQ
jgi:sulfonate transport system substrate-binding protein